MNLHAQARPVVQSVKPWKMAHMETAISYPACANPMRNEAFERKYGGEVAIDLCFDCKQIWFDEFKSAQIAPGGLIKLFKLINEYQDIASHPMAESLNCPRCRSHLVLTHDLERSNRLLYYRCQKDHGRLTAFYQFLREKTSCAT